MTSNVMLAQPYALRAHLDAMILAAEADAGIPSGPQVEAGSCQQCGASPEHVADTSTLDGVQRSRCSTCGAEWER